MGRSVDSSFWKNHKKIEIDDISRLIYHSAMTDREKPVGWLHGEIKTPPFSSDARIEAGSVWQEDAYHATGSHQDLPKTT
jgi:hypothetical protein